MKILHNVLILKMDDRFGEATALAWKGDKILAVGSSEELFHRYPIAEKIDGDGYTVLPGFIDPHNHFIWGILFNGILSCTPDQAPTIDALKRLLFDFSKTRKQSEWIVAQGYDAWEFAGKKTPTRYDLDEACPDNPAVIVHYSMHECVANTRALDAAGINRNTAQPIGGKIKKSSGGDPTGHLVELAITKVEKLARENLIKQTGKNLIVMMKEAQDHQLSLGITRFCDAAVSPELEAIYRDAMNQGAIKMPIIMNPSSETGLYELPCNNLNHEPTGASEGLLTVGPLKLYLDGGDQCCVKLDLLQLLIGVAVTKFRMINTFSMDPLKTLMRSEMRLGRDLRIHTGLFTSSMKDYQKLSSQAVEKDFSLCIHAIGNEAVEYVADIVKKVRNRHRDQPPPRIDHALFVDDELIKKMADLGIVVVTQPYFLTHMYSGNIPYLHGLKKVPLRSFLDNGVRVAGSSDWPVASNNPMLAMERAVTRRTRGDERLQEDEALTINEALALYTRNAAYALGCENEIGSIEAGKLANFILLSHNPHKLREGEWGDVKVIKTYISGEQVFSLE